MLTVVPIFGHLIFKPYLSLWLKCKCAYVKLLAPVSQGRSCDILELTVLRTAVHLASLGITCQIPVSTRNPVPVKTKK